ncbi:MAG TPA: choice-of-anchor tandem repeat GloVer-containing protein, partial [Cyclobacteriaceae bacterium]
MKLRLVLILSLLCLFVPLLKAQVVNPRLWISSDFGGKGHGSIVNTDLMGQNLKTIKIFEGDPMGADPGSGLITGLDGNFYGTTMRGGAFDKGTIYKIAKNDNSFTKLFEFNGTTQGGYPMGNLVQSANGELFGVTNGGGSNGMGALYKIAPDGTNFSVLTNFIESNGYYPNLGPVKGMDGNFYGSLDGGA